MPRHEPLASRRAARLASARRLQTCDAEGPHEGVCPTFFLDLVFGSPRFLGAGRLAETTALQLTNHQRYRHSISIGIILLRHCETASTVRAAHPCYFQSN